MIDDTDDNDDGNCDNYLLWSGKWDKDGGEEAVKDDDRIGGWRGMKSMQAL